MTPTIRVLSRWGRSARLAGVACAAVLWVRAADRGAWDFTLPTLAGDRFVRASRLAGPVLVNFWGSQCPPCIEELPRLQAFAGDHRNWTVLLVCTDPPQEARVFLDRHHITLIALRAGTNVIGLLRAAGDARGALPFTVLLQDGRVVRTYQGALSTGDLAGLAGPEKTGKPPP
ncbi:MAG TPA: TlpA disulfide reductase family protein [Opitutaceae bacterium]|nr:TlpA disulfide reductase family protein [Opitutaceae bacterium]